MYSVWSVTDTYNEWIDNNHNDHISNAEKTLYANRFCYQIGHFIEQQRSKKNRVDKVSIFGKYAITPNKPHSYSWNMRRYVQLKY